MPRHKIDPPWYSTVAKGKTQTNVNVPKPLMGAIENENLLEWKITVIKEDGKMKFKWDKLETHSVSTSKIEENITPEINISEDIEMKVNNTSKNNSVENEDDRQMASNEQHNICSKYGAKYVDCDCL